MTQIEPGKVSLSKRFHPASKKTYGKSIDLSSILEYELNHEEGKNNRLATLFHSHTRFFYF